ncbi:period circadian protein isoform X1 [Cloeon dipterum]|uniref:period circadian protein isoform X1 n=1 Tax=Cloeon dipterum TaxID=197152 RepID=UPI0032209219
MEENDEKTKVSDSAYSNSCNSRSQRSSGSSKSRHSTSSGSSGYCGHPSTVGSNNDQPFTQPQQATKRKEKKKKLSKSELPNGNNGNSPNAENSSSGSGGNCNSSCGDGSTGTQASSGGQPTVSTGPLEKKSMEMAAAALSQSLSNKKKKNKEQPGVIPEECEIQVSSNKTPLRENEEQILHCLQEEQYTQNEGEFCAVVSMHDGVVMYTTASLTEVLGFPKDMWLGRSFIDFVHPKDRISFASHITSGVAAPQIGSKGGTLNKNSFFCSLRQYRGLKSSGYSVTEKKVTYKPFRLSMSFKELQPESVSHASNKDTSCPFGTFLLITAVPIQSVYKITDEPRISPKFLMRHSASGELIHVDNEAVPHFGYLPQDMIGVSVFDFFHPEDMHYLKEVYMTIMKEQQNCFESRPYRFRTQNGGYILMKTEWSSFINPWSRKLEFVIGHNRVLQGPPNPDVFQMSNDDEVPLLLEEIVKESKIIQEEILFMLNQPVTRPLETAKQQVSKRCKDLATFMESLMDEKISKPDLKVDLPPEEQSFSVSLNHLPSTLSSNKNFRAAQERDSVMLGEISPHHDYYDSKSSTETPPSYNQLNYNENIQRFFESKPKTTFSDESGEMKLDAQRSGVSTDEEGKDMTLGADTSSNGSGVSAGSGTNEGMSPRVAKLSPVIVSAPVSTAQTHHLISSGGVIKGPDDGGGGGVTCPSISIGGNFVSYKTPHLTMELLYRHNEDMEKIMVQKHREQRCKSSSNLELKKGDGRKGTTLGCGVGANDGDGGGGLGPGHPEIKLLDPCHGIKRSVSHSWEGETHKASKHTHLEGSAGNSWAAPVVPPSKENTNAGEKRCQGQNVGPSNVNLWPPFSVTFTPMHNTQPYNSYSSHLNPAPTNRVVNSTGMMPSPVASVIPMYYISPNPHQPTGMTSHENSSGPMPRIIPPSHQPFPAPQIQYVNAAALSNMLYQPLGPSLFGSPSPMLYPSLAVLQPTLLPSSLSSMGPQNVSNLSMANSNNLKNNALNKNAARQFKNVEMCGTNPNFKIGTPTSQTSMKVEPGSVRGAALRLDISQHSIGLTSTDEDEKKGGNMSGSDRQSSLIGDVEVNGDDSSCSICDSSMKSSPSAEVERNCEDMQWESNKAIEEEKTLRPMLKKEPPWLEEVHVTADLVYRYQVEDRTLEDVLAADLEALNYMQQQPNLVNEQLSQLYLDMELEGFSAKMSLEECISICDSNSLGSSSSGEETQGSNTHAIKNEMTAQNEKICKIKKPQKVAKKQKGCFEYSRLVMIYEENAPIPPPKIEQ